jgi:hypothetical protein
MAGSATTHVEPSVVEKYQQLAQEAIQNCPDYPEGKYEGRGVVMCGGGLKYFTCAWVAIKMLRHVGCQLPVELWHLGKKEMDDTMRNIIEPLGVTVVDAYAMNKEHPVRKPLGGWELNPYSILHSKFKEILFLDADNVCVVNPEYLFESDEYRRTGAIFWPDYGKLAKNRAIWKLCGVEYRDEPEFESGQIVVDKERCWREVNLTMHLNEHSEIYYKHVHGDKETYHMAWHMLKTPYSMPSRGIHRLPAVMCQHDFWGNRVFQHRNLDKWKLRGENNNIQGFLLEKECKDYLKQLRDKWTGVITDKPIQNLKDRDIVALVNSLKDKRYLYIREGHDQRPIRLLNGGLIGEGSMSLEMVWWIIKEEGQSVLCIGADPNNITCKLSRSGGDWKGRWLKFEKMPITLRALG